MKTQFQLLAVALLFSACGSTGRNVDLSIQGSGGQVAYFDRFENNQPVHVDSVKLNGDGKGSITLPPLPLDYYRIAIGNEQLVVVLDSAESLQVEASLGSLQEPAVLTGSVHTDLLREFQKSSQKYENDREELRKVIADNPGNTDAIDAFNNLNSTYYESCKAFVNDNSTSPVVLSAVNRLNVQQDLDLMKKVREDLRSVMPRSGFFAAFRDQIDRQEQQLLMQKMQEEEMKRLSNLLPIGSEAPEIRQQTPSGGTFALSQLRGKVVLIDFWASWCKPCRFENPAVKMVYDKYKGKGFEILGVSLDRDQSAWVAAIAQDGINWKHVSDLGFWNNAAAQEYGVSSIPYTVLVDREGKILAKGLRSHDLEAKLAELL